MWLSPVQVAVIPIADRHREFCGKVLQRLKSVGIRAELDNRDERMNAKIRDAELKKIPYVLVVGDREIENGAVAVRGKKEGNLGSMGIEEFIRFLQNKLEAKE